MTDTATSATPFPVPFHKTWLHRAFASAKTKAGSHMYLDLADAHPEGRVSVLWRMVTYCPLSGANDTLYMDWINLWYAAVLDLLDLNQEESDRSAIFINHLLRGPEAVLEGSRHNYEKNPKASKLLIKILVQSWMRASDGLSALFRDSLLRLAARPEMTSAVANALRHGDYRQDRYQELRGFLKSSSANGGYVREVADGLIIAIDYAAFSFLGSEGRDFFNEIAPCLDGASPKVRVKVFAILNRDRMIRQVNDLVTRTVQETLDRLGESHRTTTFVVFVTPSDDIYDNRVTVDLTFDACHAYGSHLDAKDAILAVLEGQGISRRLAAMLDSVSRRARPISFIAHLYFRV